MICTNRDAVLIAQAEQDVENAQQSLDDLLNPTPLVIAEAEKTVLRSSRDALDDAQHDVDRLARGRGSDEQIALAQADYLIAQENYEYVQNEYDKVNGDPAEDTRKALALTKLEDAKTRPRPRSGAV